MLITSSQNEGLKNLRKLIRDKKTRREQSLFVCEGVTLVKDIPGSFSVDRVFVKESKQDELSFITDKYRENTVYVKDELFDSVCDTVTPSGILAVVRIPKKALNVSGDTVLLLDGISDAGNLGTIIRSAAARGIRSVLLVDCADAYSPKAVRSAMSGTFYVDVTECTHEEAFGLLQGYDIVALDMGGDSVFDYSRKGKIAIAVGNEAHGISEEVKLHAKTILAIPMTNTVESLNAAVSISIAMFII